MSISVEAKTIKVKYTCACDRCGTVNVEEPRTMELEQFNNLSKSDPKDYWKEDDKGVTVYRHHEESSSGRCKQSC